MINDLDEDEVKVLSYVAQKDQFKVGRQVYGRAGGKSRAREILEKLEDEGLIVRAGHGHFYVTWRGKRYRSIEVSCLDCGRTFKSLKDVEQNGLMTCSHSRLSTNLKNWKEEE